MSSRSRQQLEDWVKTIDVSGKVLDIGGSQKEILGRTKTWFVNEYKVLDLERPHELKRVPDIVADINKIGVFEALRDEYEKYDVIFCLEVSEYWYNPQIAFKNLFELLKKGGVVYASFHTLYGLHNPKGEDCLRYSINAIEKLAEHNGFFIEDIFPRTMGATGRSLYYQFCKSEGMRLDFQDPETYMCGYLVKMKKL